MFREVRRKNNEISINEAKQLLKTERRAVLSVNGDNGYPYGVPINYWYSEEDEKIYFHGSRIGHKIESIKKCDKVCFTVYGNESIKEEPWAPYVQSVVVFGKCKLIMDQNKAKNLVREFASKYYPNLELVDKEIELSGAAVQMFEIEIEHMTAKEVQEK